MNKETLFTYSYRFRIGQVVNFLIGVGFLGMAIGLLLFVLNSDEPVTFFWTLFGVLIIMGLIPLFLSVHYLIRSFGQQVIINSANQQIDIRHKGRFASFNFSDLTSIEICEHEMIGRYGFDFGFAKYSFASGECCIVTAYMTNQYFIPNGIKPRIYEEIVPIIRDKTTI